MLLGTMRTGLWVLAVTWFGCAPRAARFQLGAPERMRGAGAADPLMRQAQAHAPALRSCLTSLAERVRSEDPLRVTLRLVRRADKVTLFEARSGSPATSIDGPLLACLREAVAEWPSAGPSAELVLPIELYPGPLSADAVRDPVGEQRLAGFKPEE